MGTAIGNKYGLIVVTRYRPRGGDSKNSKDFMDNVKPIGISTFRFRPFHHSSVFMLTFQVFHSSNHKSFINKE